MRDRSLVFNLEPTFRCNLACEMCPRFSSEDPHLDMAAETYDRISRSMRFAHTVDFTGWGEPLLHPRIYSMIATARANGCRTTMTSNGTALTARNACLLIDAGLDALSVSVDGTSPATYNSIRAGSDFQRISSHLQALSDSLVQSRSRMEVAIAFTIQEINAEEVESLVDWATSVGVRTIHLKHLNAVSNAGDWERSFLKYRLGPRRDDPIRLARVEIGIARAIAAAEHAGVQLNMYSEHPLTGEMRGRHCIAAPLHAVYFSYEGQVAPCCHFGHSVSRFFEGRFFPPSSMFFGDIKIQSLEQIWESPQYTDFRTGFLNGNFPHNCRNCYLLYGK